MENQEKVTIRERARNLLAKSRSKVAAAALGLSLGASSFTALASEAGTSNGIDINFEPTQMFTYSNVIIDCLMPVVYITAGLSLGFTVIYALKNAFGNRM